MQSTDDLNRDIVTGELKKLYYIYGNENYLKRHWLAQIKKSMFGDDSMPADIHYLDGKDCDVSVFADLLDAVPVFSPRKLIIVTDAAINGEICTYLLKNKTALDDDTVLVFYAETEPFDERLKDFKAFSGLLSACGLAVKIDTPDLPELKKWIAGLFADRGVNASDADISYLLAQTGNSMDAIANEVEKLSAYCGKTLSRSAIDLLTVKAPDAKTYELIDAVLDKNKDQASAILYSLMQMRTDGILMLGSIFNAVCNLYKIKIYLRASLSVADIAKKTGMRDFVVRKYAARLKNIPFSAISSALEMCCKADIDSKSTSAEPSVLLTGLVTKMTEVL